MGTATGGIDNIRFMGTAIGDVLPLAIGVAVSPIPIIATILMLLTPRAGSTATAFLAGWVLGIAVAYAIFVVVGSAIDLSTDSDGNAVTATIRLVLGLLMLGLAAKQWRGRPAPGEEPTMPAWLSAMDKVTPVKAVALGFALSAVNPKNLLMIVGAAVAVSQLALSAGSIVVVGIVFTVLAASTVAAPVIGYFTMRERATSWLNGLKTWLTANNAAVMSVLLLVIGVSLIGKGIGGY
ncbi:threonine/homoserine/homoserine lactone efflux protein [Prescottella agglutinans]|uniref:Threonine/homoserine/homoserine lactone efflux protein n=2 Tax=Prescottella agglutinans TaxID=1644129 RepID=A0ABT6MBM7_9NOCA|nr:threonine/homoserine/homoserine lactone efflux protein [Prescottella agglutinans]